MGVGTGLYMYDVVVKSSRSLSHLLMSSCYGMHPLRSLVTSVLGHFGPRTDLHVHFGLRSLRSSDRSLAKSDRSSGNTQLEGNDCYGLNKSVYTVTFAYQRCRPIIINSTGRSTVSNSKKQRTDGVGPPSLRTMTRPVPNPLVLNTMV